MEYHRRAPRACLAWLLALGMVAAACAKSPGRVTSSGAPAPGVDAAMGPPPPSVKSDSVAARARREVDRLDYERATMERVGRNLRALGPAAARAVALLLRDPDVKRRRRAATALGLMRSMAVSALPDLLAALADPAPQTDRDWKEDLVYALGRIGRPIPSVVAAVSAALGHAAAGVRRAACRVLGRFGAAARSALPALIRARRDDRATVRKAARQAIRRLEGSSTPR